MESNPKYPNSNKTAWYLILFFLILLLIIHFTTCTFLPHAQTQRYRICTTLAGCDTVTEYKTISGTGWISYITNKGDTNLVYHPQIETIK